MKHRIQRIEDDDGIRWYQDVGTGLKYISVTHVLSYAVHPKLKNWFVNNSKNKINKILERSSNIGTILHSIIENDLSSKPNVIDRIKYPECSDEEIASLKKAFENWLVQKTDHEISATHTELVVCSDEFGYAGSLDILGTFDGKPALMDLKTGRYDVKAGWQMAAYRRAVIEAQLADESLGMVGIQVKRDGLEANTFIYSHYDFCFNKFLACMELFKAFNFYKLEKMNWPWLKQKINFTIEEKIQWQT